MNWYRKAQYPQSTMDNYLIQHKKEDAVWIFDQQLNLYVDYPEEGGRVTHNRSFGTEGKNYMFKGRYNPQTKIVHVIDHPKFITTDQEYMRNKLEEKLWQEFKEISNIKYY